jgi:hypothetical protein
MGYMIKLGPDTKGCQQHAFATGFSPNRGPSLTGIPPTCRASSTNSDSRCTKYRSLPSECKQCVGVAPLLSQEKAKGSVVPFRNKRKLTHVQHIKWHMDCTFFSLYLSFAACGLQHGRKDSIFSIVPTFPLASLIFPQIFGKLQIAWATQPEGFAVSCV